MDLYRLHPTCLPTSQNQSQTMRLHPFPIFISSHSSHLSSQKSAKPKKSRYPMSPHPHPHPSHTGPHLVLLRCARSAARRCLRALGPSAKAPPTTSTAPSSEAPSEISSSEESLSTASSVPGIVAQSPGENWENWENWHDLEWKQLKILSWGTLAKNELGGV